MIPPFIPWLLAALLLLACLALLVALLRYRDRSVRLEAESLSWRERAEDRTQMLRTAEEVASTDHDGHLHTLLYGRNDLLGNATNHLGIDADLATTECFAGKLEQNSARIVAISHIVPFSKPKVRNYP